MACVSIAIDAPFAMHLQRAGIGMVPLGSRAFWEESWFEPPMNLFGVEVWHGPVEIGAFTYFGPSGLFVNASIGRYSSVGDGVVIGGTRHPTDWLTSSPVTYVDFLHFQRFFMDREPTWERRLPPSPAYDMRPRTTIGNDVWIGSGAWIKDGVTIGDGAVIGAKSVVTRDVPEFAIVAGSPARLIRYRFSLPIIERLRQLAWWRYNIYDFAGVDCRNVPASIKQIEKALGDGKIQAYNPSKINLITERRIFDVLHSHQVS